MPSPRALLLAALAVVVVLFIAGWVRIARRNLPPDAGWPDVLHLLTGFVTNFFDTLGIGSFATTTSIYKLRKAVQDQLIPGTLNVGHTVPTFAQAFIYIAIVTVDMKTLVTLIVASMLGAWLGAGVVCRWSRRKVQIGMGAALLAAATLMLMTQLGLFPHGGDTLGLSPTRLAIGFAGNFALGALMSLGIGLYAPCMILVSLLGMSPTTAFPIMMGSCAFLMPVGSLQFLRKNSYDLKAALGLSLGGLPAVLIAAYIVKSLRLTTVRWLVIAVVVYTATMMLRSALQEHREATKGELPAP
jgi:uncharacterized membrane protein YfcA